TVTVTGVDDPGCSLNLRVPTWCREPSVMVNGQDVDAPLQDGYLTLARSWLAGDVITLQLPMTPLLLAANPRVDPTRASVAIQRGPLVFCLEGHDQAEDIDLMDVAIDVAAPLAANWQPDLLGGVVTVTATGASVDTSAWDEQLYCPADQVAIGYSAPVPLTAIPYFAWANRTPSTMRVWIPRKN
ncbi:MAG: glycoside hydrolase family 127 protein, partial [Caldilineaceae bacterium]|nr:glycoside hydrolase family 127 protein [Caldilineaceae bacterium]